MRLIPRGSRRERVFVLVLGLLGHLALRLLGWTTRKTYIENGLLARFARGEPVILAFWHGRMLMMPFAYRGRGACIMNSRHRDGALISRAIRPFGIEVVHGSSTRGWVGGMKGLLGAARRGRDLVVVPDGPKGPRQKAKSGVVQLARTTGIPIFPVAYSATRARVLAKAWDGFVLPMPGSHVFYVAEEPIWVPRAAEGAEIEAHRAVLEERLDRAAWRADQAAGVALWDWARYTAADRVAASARLEDTA